MCMCVLHVQVGDIQHFYFREGDPPPWYKPNLPPSEYIGKAKGMKQIMWERGLWKDGMLVDIDEDDQKGRDQVWLKPTLQTFFSLV